jgi:t-SNARE complex subunit (syntaxin)
MEITSLVLSLIGTLVASMGLAVATESILRRFRKKQEEETVERRIQRLSTSLKEAVGLINQIEEEIKSRQALVEKLKSDIETYNSIVSLKRTEVEAVAQVLRKELKTEGRRSFWRSVAVNFVFFSLGAVASFVLIKIFG